jgi:hypothetical protein
MRSIIPPRLEALIRSRLGAPTPPPVNTTSTARGYDPSETPGPCSRARRRRKSEPPTSCVLSDAEIARTLMRYRYDRTFRGERRVPIKTLAGFVGLSHETVYQAMRGAISDRTRVKLSWALTAINDRRLQFRRRGQRWQVDTAGLLLPNSGY